MSMEQKEALSAATYVLGLTDPLQRRQLDKRLDEDDDFAAEVARWQKAFSAVDITTRDVAPSPGLWQHIARDLVPHQTAQVASSAGNRPLFWLGWALAATLGGVVILTQVIKPDSPSALQTIAILSDKQSERQFVVMLDRSVSTLQVSALGVTLPHDKTLQLWMIKGSAPPRSLGLITQRDGNTFKLPAEALDNQTVLAISLEPPGGSPLPGPSGPVVYQGSVRAL
ncbi:anti-sigma factor [Kluyvera sp. CHPC 1.2972]|mgnify:CR=1 FL=1|uniref:anti-sigma factor n=1 Tax=Kluyvera sp. CHPC 1.2972 TaxID=2995176 RepID=UPI002FD7B33F